MLLYFKEMELKMENIFCPKHIIGLIWVTIMIILLYLLSNKIKAKKGINTVLKGGAILLVGLEIIKYIYLIKTDDFSMFYFPIQFCSLMLYAYPLTAFFIGKKVSKFVLPFAFSAGLLAGLLALFLPTNILGDPDISWLNPKNFLYTFSFVYHGIMVWYSSYLAYSKFYKPKYKDTINSVILILLFAGIAILMNLTLQQDYMMLRVGAGNPLAFLIDINYFYYLLVQLVLFIILNFIFIFVVKIFQKEKRTA